jgi:hypothetical protein
MDFEHSMHMGRIETRFLGLHCPFYERVLASRVSGVCVCKKVEEIEVGVSDKRWRF